MHATDKSARFWFATRFVIWVLLVLWSLISHFQRAVERHGFASAVLLFAFIFLFVEFLLRADRRLRHRNGIPWVSRLYSGIAWATVAALLLALLLIVK
jgi:hypothetical protein